MDNGPTNYNNSPEANAILGKGAEFEGKLAFEGTVRIEGKFLGEISSEGTLVVGQGARVEANIAVATIIINGDVIGDIRATSLVSLQSTGRLKGNILTAGLSVAQGAVFDGACRMSDATDPVPCTLSRWRVTK